MPFISEKDKADIILAVEKNLDYIALSFTNNENDVKAVREIISTCTSGNKDIKLIAKIESTDGVNNLKSIFNSVDGIMVARGDLGIEIPYYEVPY
jgi:pyruvate kinase